MYILVQQRIFDNHTCLTKMLFQYKYFFFPISNEIIFQYVYNML